MAKRAQGLAGLVLAALALLLFPGAAAAQGGGGADGGAVELRAGNGETLQIEREPFRVSLRDRDGRTSVATVAGREGPPVRVPGIDGPFPLEPLGPLGGFPAMGFVVGEHPSFGFPTGSAIYTGNRLFGAEAGVLVSVVEVVRVERTGSGLRLRLRTDAPSIGLATLTVRRLPGGGVRMDLRPPSDLDADSTMFTLASPGAEGLYGLGARKDDFDQRGSLRNVWVEQQNASDERLEEGPGRLPTEPGGGEDFTFPNGAQAAYYVQAALHGSRGWAAWVGQSTLSRLDLASSRGDAIRWGVASPELTLSLAGGGLERSAMSYTAEAGRAPAPPRYVYEPWIDVINEGEGAAAPNGEGFSGGERVKSDLQEIVRKARELRLPIGTLGVEGWHTVPGARRFFERLRERGYHLSAYWNPYTAEDTPAYDEALDLGIFIDDPTGQPFPIVTSRGGIVGVIDYSHPRAQSFWNRQIERSCDLGFEAFMHDFGEFVIEGMRFHNGNPPAVEHNAYPVRYHRAARVALERCAERDPGFEPFFYVRAGYSGIDGGPGVVDSTSAVFPGDETTDWAEGSGIPSVPPAMLNMAIGGGYSFTTDVGGYFDFVAPRTSPELFTRWSQLAAFTAVMRVHNSTNNGSVYPFTYGDAMLRTYRRYARAKERLIPLVDRWSHRAARTGAIGPVRPLVLEDSSRAARSIDDQWLLGRRILVAPVLEEGARSRRVYLPRGSRWQRVTVDSAGRLEPAGRPLDGGRRVTAPAPLADIPVFVRAGSVRDPGGDGDGGGRADGPGGRPSSPRGAPGDSVDPPADATDVEAAGDASVAVGAAAGTGDGAAALPLTGLSLAAIAAAGVVLLLVGRAARWRGRRT